MELKTKISLDEPCLKYLDYGQVFCMRQVLVMNHEEDNNGNDFDAGVAIKMRAKLKRPNLYRVLLLNDDYTPMDFVIFILEKFFRKQREDAIHIMWNVHHNGVGECGIYSFEVAETKVAQVMDCARENQHPLKCVMERK